MVGPDLAHVQERHPEEWIRDFIRSSQSVIKSGDEYADSLFKAFNQMQMPDQPNLTDGQLTDIIAYIREMSGAPQSGSANPAPPVGNSNRGRDLFLGNKRFVNLGASCNSCHNVEIEGFISGGALGKDLTHAIGRLSEAGVASVISGLPYPQMKETNGSRPVTPQEIADLTAFLSIADKQPPAGAVPAVGHYMLIGGLSGMVAVLVLFSAFWINRKKQPVNFSVFQRQTKSA